MYSKRHGDIPVPAGGGGGPPRQYYRVIPEWPRAMGLVGLLSRLWLFRVRGGFVCPFRWFAFGVGFGRPAWRMFRLSLMLDRVWLGPSRLALVFVMCGGFVSFCPLFGASRWSTQAENLVTRVVR